MLCETSRFRGGRKRVGDQLFPRKKDMSRREVASVEEGRDVERVAEMMRVNDERVVLRRESW